MNVNGPSLLMVSQDRHEIYLTFASYKEAYLNYLKGKDVGDPGFLTMQEYGPWHTKNYKHMRQLAKIIVAFALRAGDGN